MNDYKNTRWLITGGTSGLGLALTDLLLDKGAKVAIVSRTKSKIQRPGLVSIPADVSNKEDIYKISNQAIGQLGGVDYLVNNASFLGATPLRSLLDTECESLTKVLETNLVGPFRLTKALLPSMILQKKGTIVNISSDAALNAYPNWGSYGMSKAALDHLTHIWAEEVSKHGIRFFSIDPGDMDTPMHAEAIPDADPTTLKPPAQAAQELLNFLKAPHEKNWQRKSL